MPVSLLLRVVPPVELGVPKPGLTAASPNMSWWFSYAAQAWIGIDVPTYLTPMPQSIGLIPALLVATLALVVNAGRVKYTPPVKPLKFGLLYQIACESRR